MPVELFQILNDDAMKVLHSICQQIWKTQQWLQDWKRSVFHSNLKERQCQRVLKLLHNCTHLTRQQCNAQILQARLQQYVNCEFPAVQAGFRKGGGTRDQIANIRQIIEKASKFQKTSASLTMPKPLTMQITANCGKLFKRWGYQTT